MQNTIFATYERESTLWKNANAFYKAQDWVKMECGFTDNSKARSSLKVIDDEGNDITASHFADSYFIMLTNKSGRSHRTFEFATRDEANEMFKAIFRHKNLPGWKKVK